MPDCTRLLLPVLQVAVASQLAAVQAEFIKVQQSWSLGLSQVQLTLEQLQQQEAQLAAGSGSISSGIFHALASPRRVAALLTHGRNALAGCSTASTPRQPLHGGESPLSGAAAEGGGGRGVSINCTGRPGTPSMLSQGSRAGAATKCYTDMSCPASKQRLLQQSLLSDTCQVGKRLAFIGNACQLTPVGTKTLQWTARLLSIQSEPGWLLRAA